MTRRFEQLSRVGDILSRRGANQVTDRAISRAISVTFTCERAAYDVMASFLDLNDFVAKFTLLRGIVSHLRNVILFDIIRVEHGI